MASFPVRQRGVLSLSGVDRGEAGAGCGYSVGRRSSLEGASDVSRPRGRSCMLG